MQTIGRRIRASGAVAVVGALALFAGACSGDTAAEGGGDGEVDTIELALVGPESGTYADIGASLERGAEIAVAQLNEDGGVLGGQVNLTIADDQGDPKLATQRLNELAGEGKHFTFGYALTPGCLAAAQAASQVNSIVASAACSGTNLVEEDLQPNFFRFGPSDDMFQYGVAALVEEQFPEVTTWSVIGPDYSVGHDMWDRFREFMADRGTEVEVRNEVFHPLDASDLTPYITSVLRGASPDEGLLITDTSGLMLNLVKQAKPYDLFGKFGAVVNGGGFLPQAYALGADVPPIWNVYKWADGAYDNEIAARFAEDFAEKYPDAQIDSVAVNAFTAVYGYAAAIEKAGSTDPEAVKEALVGLTFDSIEGAITIGDNHQASSTMIARRFEPDPGAEHGFTIAEVLEVPSDPSAE